MRVRRIILTSVVSVACTASDAVDSATDDGTTQGSSTTTSDPDASSSSTTSNSGSTSTSSTSLTTADPTHDSTEDSSSTGEEVGTPGCRVAEPLADGEHVFTLDDLERRYIVRLPRNYSTDRAWPLVFALHGNGGNPGYWDQTGGDRDIRTAFADEAILIIPEAINNAWRDYGEDPSTWPAGMELELDFFDAVYETAQDELCIDTSNVFSMGFSGGGSFSGVLGCRRDYIRAIAVGGSVIYFEEQDCTEQPAAWITIGEGELNAGRIAFRDFFVQKAGCDDTSTPGEPEGCVDYDNCDDGSPAIYCSHPAGHVWPSIGTDATREFFRSFYLP
jgi:polyhydroxybutyrate depolymerase